ncbi:matrix-remodeling-associated protein 5-like isoform X2 [Micropterus salmoides]|uniref:matrix-remodeling-associated protein 5-like isoform X2 n=1 Tax=Micropterus salmoides TaxID=27706 RepID=UPI0018EAD024|nr:matrix-remodeling-associated protein 5-like isoform X2 [Micropterus salmoides]
MRLKAVKSTKVEYKTGMICLLVFLLARLSPASSDVVRVKPGDDVILPCQAGEASIRAVEWTRPDLESDYVLLYRDGRSDPTHQHPSFKDRVQLVDRELKDGDVSLILKNVSSNDAGTYECRVAAGDSRRKRANIETEPIRIYQLEVSDVVRVKPGDDVILPCQAGDVFIRAVEWTRPDLEPEYVLFYRGRRSDPTQQHPSFKDRVQLVDRELKDGDVSLILKNVSSNDAGTYECRVAAGDSRRKRANIETEPIRIIQLEVSDVVQVKPGDDVILPCQAGDVFIRAVEWTRPDLEPEYVLFYRGRRSDPTQQHPSFKDRVQLVDRELKDGDVSLILKNVSSNDAGTYECRVAAGDSRRKRANIETEPIRIIQLEVSGSNSGDVVEGNYGLYYGLGSFVLFWFIL